MDKARFRIFGGEGLREQLNIPLQKSASGIVSGTQYLIPDIPVDH
jgi:hypothetical protein